MSQIPTLFQIPTRSVDIEVELEGETGNLGKRLEWRDRDETW